jgi:signal transduction histidine kinase/putative methionine-R-sulfoxide reductase with GAF domain
MADDTSNAGDDAGGGDGEADRAAAVDDPASSRKIRRLHEVATAMQAATSVEEIYDLTVDAGVDILGFDWCGVEIAVEGYFEVVAASDEVPIEVGTRPITTDHGVTGEAYREGESDIIHDAHADADADPTLELFRSGLTVPLEDRGVFQGFAAETHYFDEEDLELAELLVAHAKAAVDRVEETRRLNELNRATRQLMTAETHTSVAREGCEIASSVLDVPLTVVFYHDEGEGALVPMAATETARDLLDGPPTVGSEDHPVWTTMAEGETVRRSRAFCDDSWEMLHVPLGEEGVLCVGSPVQGAFDGNDVALAETIAANIESAFTRADREQRRREQAHQLQRQNERLDQFASIVSHDLRNPLHIARTRAALAREECGSEHLTDFESALDRMETIIEDTLSLARKGQTVEETEPVPLSRVVSRSWDQVETRGANLEIVSDGVIHADPDRLQSVFENLFRNSVEHGSAGPDSQSREATGEEGSTDALTQSETVDLSVRLGTLPDGFYVEDTGCGIPEDDRDRIFDLGYSTDDDGTGFGLAIVGEIVESHGWEIEATESDEGGARFEITGVEVE